MLYEIDRESQKRVEATQSSFIKPVVSNGILANHLYICKKFKLDFSSCDLFKSYELSVNKLKETTLKYQTVSHSRCSKETAILPAW